MIKQKKIKKNQVNLVNLILDLMKLFQFIFRRLRHFYQFLKELRRH